MRDVPACHRAAADDWVGDAAAAYSRRMLCKVCGDQTTVTHHGLLLGKHRVAYHRCPSCDFWCTDEPHWLEEAYGDAIAQIDTGIMARNLWVAERLARVLDELLPDGPFVDWAGGPGTLVRLMRDQGFDYYWQDRYSANVFARGYEWHAARSGTRATAVTAIEALEHAPDPLVFIDECLAATSADSLIFTQELHGGRADPDWWYLAPTSGQHISFFGQRTLHAIAERLDMSIRTAGSLHLLTRTDISQQDFTAAVEPSRQRRLHQRVLRRAGLQRRVREPLTQKDHEEQVRLLTTRPALTGSDPQGQSSS